MTRDSAKHLKSEIGRVLRSMDFVSRHPALDKRGKEGERFAEIYQQLGALWEFLGLQCKHNDGWRKSSGGKEVCKICGIVKGAEERWILLPRVGNKRIGRRATPNSKGTFPNRKAATLVNDTIEFHGAKLNVEVLNQHRSTWRFFRKHDWTIAADRLVRLDEGGVQVRLDTHMVTVELRKHKRGEMPPYSAFPSELPRKMLKNFPVILQYDKRGKFTGLTIFKPLPQKKRNSIPSKPHKRK